MKAVGPVLAVLLCALSGRGQEQMIDFDELASSAEQWAKENLNDDALRVVQGAERKQIEALFADLNQQFESEYVLDLPQLRAAAKTVLPLLESYEETLPYAIWLKTRLDYFDVAEQLRLTVPPPKVTPGQPLQPPPNPPAEQEREIWIQKLVNRPWPPAAKPFVAQLKPVFATNGVPPELVWIAEVESSFDPRARSPAGAAGLFQLMPATAQRYGLRTWPFDQRLKPQPSGEAAAKYLRFLHGRYKDWRLALAAYNSGEGTVDRLLARSKTKTFDAIATRLPAETQMFVPKVEATILKRENLKLSQLKANVDAPNRKLQSRSPVRPTDVMVWRFTAVTMTMSGLPLLRDHDVLNPVFTVFHRKARLAPGK